MATMDKTVKYLIAVLTFVIIATVSASYLLWTISTGKPKNATRKAASKYVHDYSDYSEPQHENYGLIE
jgi:hypothetical protein